MGARDERDGGRWYVVLWHDTRSRRRPSAAEATRSRGGDGRASSSAAQLFSVEPAPQVGVEVANPRRVPRESGGETRREEEWRGARYRTQVARAHTASAQRSRRGEEDTNEARKRRDKRDREIEARVGDWPRDRERQTESETESERALFPPPPRSLLLRIDSTRASSVSAHRRSIDATIATTIVARAHLQASLSRRPGSPRRPRCRCSGGWTPGKMR